MANESSDETEDDALQQAGPILAVTGGGDTVRDAREAVADTLRTAHGGGSDGLTFVIVPTVAHEAHEEPETAIQPSPSSTTTTSLRRKHRARRRRVAAQAEFPFPSSGAE